MPSPRSRSDIGRSNNDRGKYYERQLADYLRDRGWPNADRYGYHAYRTSKRERVDALDITGTHGILWSVKADGSRRIHRWMEEADTARQHADADHAVLVVCETNRRRDNWSAWLYLTSLITLTVARRPNPVPTLPVRLNLSDLVQLLHHAGYGNRGDSTRTVIRPGQAWSNHRGETCHVIDTDPDINDPFLTGPKLELINATTGVRSYPSAHRLHQSYTLTEDTA